MNGSTGFLAVYGVDYKGNTCGKDGFPKYTVYPRLNEDFIINVAKSSPLDYRFYGICVESCPQQGTVVCNQESAAINANTSGLYTNAAMAECFDTGASAGIDCDAVKDSCWYTAVDSSSILFRCMPAYGVNNTASSRCIFPSTVQDSWDPVRSIA